MSTRLLVLWPLGAALGVALAVAVATNTAAASVVAGGATLVFSGFAGLSISRHWKRRADAFAAAAKGLQVEPLAGEPDAHAPSQLAKEVQTTAQSAVKLARDLAVLRAVIDGMAEGVWVTNEDGTVLEHNDALKELLYSGTEIVGHRPVEIVRSAELQLAVEKACREHQPSRLEINLEGVMPRVLSIHVSPLGHDLGGSAAVFFDVTDLRRLEKVRKDFVANVSHELRTPVTAIRGYAETLLSGALSDPATAPKMVDIIHRQSERLSELVEDLLELSRLESKQLQLAEKPVNLAESAQRASEAIRPKARLRNTTVELQVPPGLIALADPRGLEQVVLNLVDNAVKYTPPNGHVWVTARHADGEVELMVKDDGPGIEARHLPRIFERFYRVDKGRSRDMGGTGLGLSIVKHLVNAMKGEVRVESAPGAGSTFYVTLPAAPALPDGVEAASAAGEVPVTAGNQATSG
ncbi:MAG: ATP-binding protein [Myxococcaceae bacterium]|jgi:two-component system phosphate regulon sensor histidine kinase PhoR|nr:ATP-binding protein [Myxococcaceae bacterium]